MSFVDNKIHQPDFNTPPFYSCNNCRCLQNLVQNDLSRKSHPNGNEKKKKKLKQRTEPFSHISHDSTCSKLGTFWTSEWIFILLHGRKADRMQVSWFCGLQELT